MTLTSFCAFLVVAHLVNCQSLQTTSSVANKLKVVFAYPTNVTSERDLRICELNSACNIIYKRFWMPTLVERLCRCPSRNECPWSWSKKTDNYTMTLNNRSQMKFCSDVYSLPDCTPRKLAIIAESEIGTEKLPSPYQHSVLNGKKLERQMRGKNLTALCLCQEPHYWKLHSNGTTIDHAENRQQQTYLCTKLKKCSQLEFCGFVRPDTFSTYYRCSCPKNHMCISKDKFPFRFEEMFYNGTGYKAYCHPEATL